MTGFEAAALATLREVAEIRIAPYAEDGFAYDGRLIWVVTVQDRVFIRSWKGKDAEWYVRSTLSRRARITIDDSPAFACEVTLHPERDAETQSAIDAEYLRKYPRPYSHEMTAPAAAETTFEVRRA